MVAGKESKAAPPKRASLNRVVRESSMSFFPYWFWQVASASGLGELVSGARYRRRARRREEEDQRGNEVSEIDDHFADGRRVLIAKNAGEQRADQAVLRHKRADVEGRALQAIPEPGFMKRAQGASEETGSHENDEDAGPAEKRAQIELHAEIVDRETHADRRGKPKRRPDRHGPAIALLDDREKEEQGFEPFAADGEEDHADQRKALAVAWTQGIVDRVMQLGLDRPGRFLHPEDHGGQDCGRQKRDQALEKFLLALREFPVR